MAKYIPLLYKGAVTAGFAALLLFSIISFNYGHTQAATIAIDANRSEKNIGSIDVEDLFCKEPHIAFKKIGSIEVDDL